MINLHRRKLIAASALTALGGHHVHAQTASPIATPSSQLQCGINYDVGSELARNELTRPAEHEQFYFSELTAIHEDLHADNLCIFGSHPDPIIAAMSHAAALSFDLRVQTRLNFINPPEMLERLTAVAEEAERLRRDGMPIVLDVGCEYMLFAEGIIEGDDFFEKLDVIESGNIDWTEIFTKLFKLLGGLATEARKVFSGLLTYSDTPMDPELWAPFDIIGIDHYLSTDSASTYEKVVNDLVATGKPVWINEFGSTANSISDEAGGMGWDVIDYDADPIQIADGVERDEVAQATNIESTLSLIEQSQAERAYLYEFITPSAPRYSDPHFDFDLTGYGIVSCWGEDHHKPYEITGYWEPKQAFDTVAEWNSR